MLKDRDIRGTAVLLPILLLVLLIVLLAKPRNDNPADRSKHTTAGVTDSLFEFDPNTADYAQLRRLGLSQASAAEVIRRQKAEWRFAVEEQLAAVYGIDDSLYYRLRPYIVIGEEFRQKPYERRSYERSGQRTYQRPAKPEPRYQPFRIDTATVAFLTTVGFSVRQAEVIVNYRDMRGGFRSIEEFAQCYVVDKDICDTLAHYIIFPEPQKAQKPQMTEINGADSAALRRVYGIGEKSVMAIIEYRDRLGGFYDLKQLAEIKTVTESNFEKILTQIYCDSCKISKIDINFASQTRLNEHPYIRPYLRKLLKKRQLKGGWSNIEEMIDDEIFNEKEAERLRPYLRFTQSTE